MNGAFQRSGRRTSPTSLNRDNGLLAQTAARTTGERPSRTAPHLGSLPLQQLRRVQEETLDSPARNAVSAPSTLFATASKSSRRAGRPPSADTAMTRSAAGQKYGYRAVGTDLAHSRQSWHKPVRTPDCLGRRGRPLRIRQGCPRRRSRRKSRRRRRIPGHHKWMHRSRKVLRQWVCDARTRITLGKWVVHAAMRWQVHEWLKAGLRPLWLCWGRPPNIHASYICTEASTYHDSERSSKQVRLARSQVRAPCAYHPNTVNATDGGGEGSRLGRGGGPKLTENVGVRQKGKHAPGGRTAPVMQTAGSW